MAHFAELDDNNSVLRVIVVNNNELITDGAEQEENGIQFCKLLYGEQTRWVQSSYNATFRGTHAAVGMVYDDMQDLFIHVESELPPINT
jgi:hypothetical protein